MIATVHLTEAQLLVLAAVLRSRIGHRVAKRQVLVTEGATPELLAASDRAIINLSELLVQVDVAQAAVDRTRVELLTGRMRVLSDDEAMLERALGVGPVPNPDRGELPGTPGATAQDVFNRSLKMLGATSPIARPRPTFNHTRSDGFYDPCPECEALMSPEDLILLRRDRDAVQADILRDESGATGTQRSDWGERGEGSEEP